MQLGDPRSLASPAPHAGRSPDPGSAVGRHRRASKAIWIAIGLVVSAAAPASASHDPNRTATIVVHGFGWIGADAQGTFGDDVDDPLADSVAALAGLPTSHAPVGPLPADVVAGTTYYGDQAPSYYDSADLAEIARLTALWGGGVPRYAFIVAKHARNVLNRSGADQVNFVSVSFGSEIVRWLIEKNVDGLAGEGRIARWLSVEGLVAGNWAASHPDLADLLDALALAPIDLRHMDYGWIEASLHRPRTEADSPYYAGILMGQIGSTDDRANHAALTTAMLASGDYWPNDGTQALRDARFQSVTSRSRFAGMPPMSGVFHADHLALERSRAAWVDVATFLVASRRVTVTMTSARVTNLRESSQPWWDWRPAEILFESRVLSPTAQSRWNIREPLTSYVKEGAAIPMRRYMSAGESQSFQQIVFDDLVLPEETRLWLDLRGVEVDYDPRYGVVETFGTPYYEDLGGGVLEVSTLASGTYSFAAADWSCQISVAVLDYPFASLVGVPGSGPRTDPATLTLTPNPFRSSVRIVAPALAGSAPGETGTLEITDASGRVVRRLTGVPLSGLVWDGRDARGRLLPAGIYLHRLVTSHGRWQGMSCLIR